MANKKIYQFPIDANLSGDNLFLMWADNITAVSTLSGVTNYIANNILVEDIYVTGGTYDGTDIILTRNDNNTVSFPLPIPENKWVIESGTTVTVNTNSQSFIYGDLIIEGLLNLEVNSKLVVLNGDIILNGGSISGDGTTQLVEIPIFNTVTTGGTYSNGTATFTNNTGGTFNVNGFYTGNTEVFITGGTYSNGTAEFTNNTGGTFNVDGFYTGSTEIFITGGTYNQSNGTAEFTNNTGGTFNVNGFLTGYTNYYTTGATLNGTTLNFNRTDTLSAYTVNLSSLGGSINYANVIFVDATNGNDSTAITGRFDKPCQSIYQASYLASLISKSSTSKALIYIRKGGYYWNGALQNYLDYYSEPGVVFTGGRVTDQSYGAVVSNFYGYSIFSNTDIYISAASSVNFEFDYMSNSGAAILIIPASGTATVTVKANYIYASTSGTGYGITIRNNSNVTMNVSRGIEAVHSTIAFRNFTGSVIINCPKIYLGSGNIYGGNFKQAIIVYDGLSTGSIVINGDIENRDTVNYGGIGSMITTWAGSSPKIKINGNIVGGPIKALDAGQGGYIEASGMLSSENQYTLWAYGSTELIFHKCRIINKGNVAGAQCVSTNNTARVFFKDTYFYNTLTDSSLVGTNGLLCKIILDGCQGYSPGVSGYAVETAVGGGLLYVNNSRFNKGLNPAITDIYSPSGFILDINTLVPNF